MTIVSTIAEFFDIPSAWADVYYALLVHGPCQIKTIQVNVEHNRQQIYNILDGLVGLSFVFITSQSRRGNVYEAKPPDKVAKEFLHKKELQLRQKKEQVEEVVVLVMDAVAEQRQSSLPESSFYGQVIPPDKIALMLQSHIKETVTSFKVAVKDFGLGLMNELGLAIKEAMERKSTKVHLLYADQPEDSMVGHRFMDGTFFPQTKVMEWLREGRIHVRTTSNLKQTYFLFDNVRLLLFISSEEEVEFALATGVDSLTDSFHQKFKKLWRNGKQVFSEKADS